MIKELKYLLFLIVIFFFIFFTLRYYFSEDNQKRNFRALSNLDQKIKNSKKDLVLLKNDTDNIIEYIEFDKNKKIKKYSFWKLLYNE